MPIALSVNLGCELITKTMCYDESEILTARMTEEKVVSLYLQEEVDESTRSRL
jgi:hypothetical protein